MRRASRRTGVVHVVDDLRVGGAQQLLVTFARVAATRGISVTVVTLQDDAGSRLGSELRALGVDVLAVPKPPTRWGALAQVLRLGRVIAGRRPSVVQTHLTMANVLGVAAARLSGVLTVATLHNVRVGEDGNSATALRLETVALRRLAHRVVAVGAAVERAQRRRLAGTRALVVPNATEEAPAVSADERHRLRRELLGETDAVLVLAVGRLVPQKAFDDLLDAWSLVPRAGRSPQLVVLGNGELGAHLGRRVVDEGLQDSVRFVGVRDDVRRVMAAADVYVSASRWEGLPVALLEAMSAGLPVVTTSVGDVPNAVDPSCALLVPPGDPSALAAGIAALVEDAPRRSRMGAAAARRAQTEFGAQGWFDALLAVQAGDDTAGGGAA